MKRTIPLPQFRSRILTLACAALILSSTVLAQSADGGDTTAPAFDAAHATAAEDTLYAWSMLTTSVEDTKHPDLRIQALAALGTMGGNPRAQKMIAIAMSDADLDVRTAAVLAAGQTKSLSLATNIRTMLDDKEPQVAYAAAIALARNGDRSGEDILTAIVEGDRKAGSGVMGGAMHTMNKDFHNPSTLAKIGALQGASMLLGPFGFGITAYEYMRKNGGDASRIIAIEELAKVKNPPIHTTLINALGDKDPGVRAAAAKALGDYRDKPTSSPLLDLFADPKPPVRLTAAAAFIRSTGAAAVK